MVREARKERAKSIPETKKHFIRDSYPDEMDCRTCGERKLLDEFSPRRASSSQQSPVYRNRSCKSCLAYRDRDRRLRRLYGISSEEYDSRLAQQGGVCALCDTDPGDTVLSVDHEHATGRVRGIICQPCNLAVGFFETRIDVERMREYLSAERS